MKGNRMYTEIQQHKGNGFSKNKTAQLLGIHRNTVSKYWNMSAKAYAEYSKQICKSKLLDEYQKIIQDWIKRYPSISSAQICDWLAENYEAKFKERTVSRYVADLRRMINIPKSSAQPRCYTALEDPPMGKQMQVDFGEMCMEKSNGNGSLKVHFAVFVLSNSRYKFIWLQSRHFTTIDLIASLRECFRYFGGIPEELVFDQDSIVCVSENNGDIVYTNDFELFRQEQGFNIFMCRPADPETKGRVENSVKYVKYGFLANRMYHDDKSLNASGIAWLERTANAKSHGTTRKIPAEVFKEEQKYLKPLRDFSNIRTEHEMRTVRKDNTIIYNGNRYSLPYTTYNTYREVIIETEADILNIYTPKHEYICEHAVSHLKGMLIKNVNHTRDTSKTIDLIQNELKKQLGVECEAFLIGVRQEKGRYVRDQFKILQTLVDNSGIEAVKCGIHFCTKNRLFSVNYVKGFIDSANYHTPEKALPESELTIPVDKPEYHVQAAKRAVSEYVKAVKAVE